MKVLCKIFGHKFLEVVRVTDKPYTGPHKWKDKSPHTLHIVNFVCQRCLYLHHVNNYFFDHDKEC